MVIAGPGTGKTELLSMRTANILQKTDTLPENILCLTFTDSGATAMRKRLVDIIGPAAYKVAIHTFHSFSTETINHNRKFFYNGATFRPADALNRFELLRRIFEGLPPKSAIASRMNGDFTHLKDALTVISELKSSGLTSGELLSILDANDEVIAVAEELIVPIFAAGIKKSTIEALMPLPAKVRHLGRALEVPGIEPLAEVLSGSLEAAINQAASTESTKPVTAWKSTWLKKDDRGDLVLKSRDRSAKLREVSAVYDQYVGRMQEAGLFDFDDMILNVVHAMELMPELQFNLQEKYLYIMVDEFQDTNLAQMRILLGLINSEINEGKPNIMVVGDDDQAIYGFQGANVGNIHSFIEQFPAAPRIVLTDNYRSGDYILTQSRSVITLGSERLETLLPDIDKTLSAHQESTGTVSLAELPTAVSERSWIATDIKRRIDAGESPGSIAVLARRHHELVQLLPYFVESGLKVSYEKRDNVLELSSIQMIECTARLLVALFEGKHELACSLLPELLAHPAFGTDPHVLWRLSLLAEQKHQNWCETMPEIPELASFHAWLLEQSKAVAHTPLERMIDIILGTPNPEDGSDDYNRRSTATSSRPKSSQTTPHST